jgi:hypothetical protein
MEAACLLQLLEHDFGHRANLDALRSGRNDVNCLASTRPGPRSEPCGTPFAEFCVVMPRRRQPRIRRKVRDRIRLRAGHRSCCPDHAGQSFAQAVSQTGRVQTHRAEVSIIHRSAVNRNDPRAFFNTCGCLKHVFRNACPFRL